MGLEELNWGILLVFVLIAGVIGSLIALWGWVEFASHATGEPQKRTPKQLVAFTMSVCVDLATCVAIRVFRDRAFLWNSIGGFRTFHIITFIGLVAGVVFLLVALGFTSKELGPTSVFVKWGSIALLAIKAAGVGLFFLNIYLST